MAEWFVSINRQQYGPVNEVQLNGWVNEGRMGPYDLIWSQGMANWVPVVTVFPNWFGKVPPPLTTQPGLATPTQPAMYVKPHRGGTVLAFGILGIVCCIIFAIVAWVQGAGDLKQMREGQMDRSGEGLTKAGMICGIIGVVVQVLAIFAQLGSM